MPELAEREMCVARQLNHVGIAVRDLMDTLEFYRDTFGLVMVEPTDLPEHGVKAAMVRVGDSQLEFIQPTDPAGGVARFIERKGEGLHHLCFEVEQLQEKLNLLRTKGVDLIDETPRKGLSGMVAFLHPSTTGGVLVELVDQDTVGG